MINFSVKERPLYVDQLLALADTHDITFVTGVRRSGKTCVAIELEQALREKYPDANVSRYNFEAIHMKHRTVENMVETFHKYYREDQDFYCIVDEMTHAQGWEMPVNLAYKYPNFKLYLFSSKEEIISPNLDAVQRNEYNVVNIFPLSLSEYLTVNDFEEITPPGTPVQDRQYKAINGQTYSLPEVYSICTKYGCMAVMKPEYLDTEHCRVILDGSYSSIVLRDIVEVDRRGDDANITDLVLLRNVITTLANSIGNNVSATWVGKQLVNNARKKPATKTVEHYIKQLLNAHLFYVSTRYDIKNQVELKTLAKYYIVDIGLHNYLAGMSDTYDTSVIESRVFFELLRRGYKVYNGKLGSSEINLVAMKDDKIHYIQVSDHLTPRTEARVLTPLRKIRDFHPKTVICFDNDITRTSDGIHVVNALEFLMGGPLAE